MIYLQTLQRSRVGANDNMHVSFTRPKIENRKSDFVMQYDVQLDQLYMYCMNFFLIILIYFENQTFQEGCPKNQS